MEKRMSHFPVPFNFEWEGETEVSKLFDDIIELKNLGATHVYINLEYNNDAHPSIDFTAISQKLETDEEFQERVKREAEMQNIIKEKIKTMEIEQYYRIKEKYNL